MNGMPTFLGDVGHYVSSKLRGCDYPLRGVITPKDGIFSHTPLKMSKFVNVKLFLLSILVAALSKGVGQQPLACWDCRFESRWRHGCLSLMSVVCCQVEGPAPD
jgi:hypothetical protein